MKAPEECASGAFLYYEGNENQAAVIRLTDYLRRSLPKSIPETPFVVPVDVVLEVLVVLLPPFFLPDPASTGSALRVTMAPVSAITKIETAKVFMSSLPSTENPIYDHFQAKSNLRL